MVLVEKKSIKKPMTEKQRQENGANDSGISWVKNMSPEDQAKYVYTLNKKQRILTIQHAHGADMSIIIAPFRTHPKVSEWERMRIEGAPAIYHPKPQKLVLSEFIPETQDENNKVIITISQNGASRWESMEELEELLKAIREGIEILKPLLTVDSL